MPLLQYTARSRQFGIKPERLKLEVLCRQWEIAELVRDMDMLENTAEAIASLASAGIAYQLMSYYYRSILLKLSSRYHEAQAELEAALEMATELGDGYLEFMLVCCLGNTKYHLSDFPGAIEYYRKALSLFGPGAKPNDRLRLMGDMGLVYWRMGQYEQALAIFTEAESLAQDCRDIRMMAVCKTNKASVMLAQNQVEQALSLYHESLAISQRIGDFQNRSILLNNIGAILIRQGQYVRAAEMLEEGIRLDRMCGASGNLSGKLSNLAIIKAMFGETAAARDLFAEALEYDRASGNLNGQMMKLCNMADLSMMLDDATSALAQIDEAVDISRRIGAEAFLAHNLAIKADICLTMGEAGAALSAAREAVERSLAGNNLDNRIHATMMLALSQSANGRHQEALECSARAVDMIENSVCFEMAAERVYLCRYEVMALAGCIEEGLTFREKAAILLKRKADEFSEPEERSRFLNNNAVYRRLKQLGVCI